MAEAGLIRSDVTRRATSAFVGQGIAGFGAAASIVAALPAAYLALITVRGSRAEDPPVSPALADDRSHCTRMVVCISAFNEERSIAATLASVLGQHYPCHRFGVHVVADNCTDTTADVARQAGAIVHERHDVEAPGKGPALNWLYDRLNAAGVLAGSERTAIVVVDADTVVDPEFLAAIDRAFRSGASAVQGFYGVRDTHSSVPIALRYAALSSRHHLRPLGRRWLGGTTGLFGNGMAFDAVLMQQHRWSGHLVEDAEFGLDLLLAGVTVRYVADARVDAEMPETLEGASSQNERWELGRAQLVRHFTLRLIRAGLGRGDRQLPRRVYLDAAADLLVPPLSLLAALDVGAVAVTALSAAVRPTRWRLTAAIGAVLSAATLVVHVGAALKSVRAPPHVYSSLLSAPRLVLWKLIILSKISIRPDRVTWTRTQRNAGSAHAFSQH